MRRSAPRRDAGSATVELAVIAPTVLALVGLVVLAGRVETARQVVAQAAQDAARAATTARSPAAAQTAAGAAARSDLAGDDCTTWHLTLSGALAPGGAMTATVTCTTRLGLLPGRFTSTSTSSAAIDLYRGTTRP